MTRETTALSRRHAIHDLLDHGAGHMDCARRLGLGLNTVKRYSRLSEPEKLRRPPQFRASLVDPYRDHLRARPSFVRAAPTLPGANPISRVRTAHCCAVLPSELPVRLSPQAAQASRES
ncbi:hypothetical protein ACWEVC_29065, partial [Nocardia africana]